MNHTRYDDTSRNKMADKEGPLIYTSPYNEISVSDRTIAWLSEKLIQHSFLIELLTIRELGATEGSARRARIQYKPSQMLSH